MADNVTVSPGTGASIAADDIGGVLHQRVKVGWGVDNSYTDTSATTPLPITVQGATLKAASTAAVAGDPALVVALSPNNLNSNGQKTSANSAPTVGASDWVPNMPKASADDNGMSNSRVVSAGSTNATSVKASSGKLVEIDLFNTAAYDVFVKFYNKASAPTVGTDTPVWTIPLKTGTGYSKSFPVGRYFSTGLAYAITKLQADSDTTAVVASDVTGTISWI